MWSCQPSERMSFFQKLSNLLTFNILRVFMKSFFEFTCRSMFLLQNKNIFLKLMRIIIKHGKYNLDGNINAIKLHTLLSLLYVLIYTIFLRFKKLLTIIALGIILVYGMVSSSVASMDPYEWALIDLDYVLQEKLLKFNDSLKKMKKLSNVAANDKFVLSFFSINKEFHNSCAQGTPPAKLKATINELRNKFNDYYMEKYLFFYDIIFVSKKGEVFYTLRDKYNISQNILHQSDPQSSLRRALKSMPKEEVFVDYHQYGPSSEPAAFFIEPVLVEGQLDGWIILQCLASKVNALFTATEETGDTVETFLVNKDGCMLTESHFEGKSTILSKHLNEKNIRAKFQAGNGHLSIVDYRGIEALTSFKVVDFMGVRWLVVAKMDKSEVTTHEYMRHRRYYAERLLGSIREATPRTLLQHSSPERKIGLRVDMDEFSKALCGQRLETWGISTCTGLLAVYPNKFGYLAHISNKDRLYGGSDTDLIGQIMKSIERFDVSQLDKNNVKFYIVAPHLDTIERAIHRVVSGGMHLSQIYIYYNSHSDSAEISYECKSDKINVLWKKNDNYKMQKLEDAFRVEEIIKNAILENK